MQGDLQEQDFGSRPTAGDVVERLSQSKLTLAVAESCTGGLISDCITDVPGSSLVFLMGVVCYANAAKESFLQVPPQLLNLVGAVSEPVAQAMAEGVRKNAGADIGLAVTGIAGPSGGSLAKPVGTVCFGWSTARGSETATEVFQGSRRQVKLGATEFALDWIRRHCEREQD